METATASGHDLDLLGEAILNASLAMFVVDGEGRCLAANAAACALTGYTVEELRALAPGGLSAFPDEGTMNRIEVVRRLRRTGTGHLLRKDGAVVEVAFTATPTTVDGRPALLSKCWPF
jgi:PAS domain S-box-containing protein